MAGVGGVGWAVAQNAQSLPDVLKPYLPLVLPFSAALFVFGALWLIFGFFMWLLQWANNVIPVPSVVWKPSKRTLRRITKEADETMAGIREKLKHVDWTKKP